jgi:DNA-binding phage protein
MDKKKTLKKQEFSLKSIPETKIKNSRNITELNPEASFLDSQKVGTALLECLIENDTETFIEILDSYLRVNKLQVAKGASLSRSTVQQAFSKNGNPTLKTLAKIVHESVLKR